MDRSLRKVKNIILTAKRIIPRWGFLKYSQSALVCSKLTIETLEQGVEYVQS